MQKSIENADPYFKEEELLKNHQTAKKEAVAKVSIFS